MEIQTQPAEITIGVTSNAITIPLLSSVYFKPIDLTGVTEITTCFLKQDGSELVAAKTTGEITILGNPILGRIKIVLSAAQTALLQTVPLSTLFLKITYSGDPIGVTIPNAYSVIQGC